MSDQLNYEDEQELQELEDTQLDDVAGGNYDVGRGYGRGAGFQMGLATLQQTGSIKQAAAAAYSANKQTQMSMAMQGIQ